jgi:hypothetical protein
VSCIFFVAELGGGFGHVRRLLPLATLAASEGHEVVFFVPNPTEVACAPGAQQLEFRRCPASVRRAPPRGTPAACSFADILGDIGFAELEALQNAASAWDVVFRELKPRAIVCEFSPFLCLAALSTNIPVLVLGYGFILPPPQLDRFPALREGVSRYEEPRLLANVCRVTKLRGAAFALPLPALFAGKLHHVTGLALLDPYRALRTQPTLGPPCSTICPVREAGEEDFFSYLLGDAPSTSMVLSALAHSNLVGSVYVRRTTDLHRELLARSQVRLLEHPVSMSDALQKCRIVVHHASMFTTEEALVAGRPQLVVPLYLEHLLTAKALLQLRVGTVLRANSSSEIGRQMLVELAADGDCARSAEEVSEQIHAEQQGQPSVSTRLWLAIRQWLA